MIAQVLAHAIRSARSGLHFADHTFLETLPQLIRLFRHGFAQEGHRDRYGFLTGGTDLATLGPLGRREDLGPDPHPAERSAGSSPGESPEKAEIESPKLFLMPGVNQHARVFPYAWA